MPRYGVWLAIALSLLALLVAADISAVDAGQRNEHVYGRATFSDRVVDLDRVPARPGDILEVWPERHLSDDAFGEYEMWAVEGGAGDSVLETGKAPATSYQHVGALRAGTYGNDGPLRFTRPEPTSGDGTHIDLVWIYRFASGVSPPQDAAAREYFDRWVESEVGAGEANTIVLERWAAAFHGIVAVLVPIAVLGTVALAGLWVRAYVRRPVTLAADEPSASLVGLVEFAGSYLGHLRALLFGLAFPLVLLGWLMLAVVGNYPAGLVGPQGWQTTLDLGLGALLLVLAGAWIVSAWTVTSAYRRWRGAAAQSPWTE